MTPPDSGAHALCADPACRLCAANRAIKPDSGERPSQHPFPCDDPHCPNRKPDSDAREVCGATRTDRCERKSGHDGAHWPKPSENPTWQLNVMIPLSLAQRILAALEEQRNRRMNEGRPASAECLHALAAKLREVM